MSYCKLGHAPNQRRAMLRDLTTDLLIGGYIVTTGTRAKEIHSTVEKMVTLGKRGDLYAHRQAAAFVRNKVTSVHEENRDIVVESASQKLPNDITPHYAECQGGYTRILKTELRHGDGVPMVVLELV